MFDPSILQNTKFPIILFFLIFFGFGFLIILIRITIRLVLYFLQKNDYKPSVWQLKIKADYKRSQLILNHKLRIGNKFGTLFEITQTIVTFLAIFLLIFEQYFDSENLFTFFEIVFSCFFLCDYLIKMYCSSDKLRYYFTKWAMIDFFSILPIIISLFIPRETTTTVRTLRVLRVFRFFNLYRILKFSSSLLKRQVIKIILTLMTLIVTSAIIIQMIEGYFGQELKFHDAIYFLVITISTVGYGDISPQTTYGRIFMIVVVLTFLIVMPIQVNDLQAINNARERLIGQVYKKKKHTKTKHIILTGCINRRVLLHFLKEFFVLCDSLEKYVIIILVPTKPSYEILNFLKHPFFQDKVKCMVGKTVNEQDLERTSLKKAKACFLFGDKLSPNPTLTNLYLVMSLYSLNNYAPKCKIYAQTLLPLSKVQKQTINSSLLISTDEIRLKMLALSTMIPGFGTLITNLFIRQYSWFSEIEPDLVYWKREYLLGTSNEFRKCIIPKILVGMNFNIAVCTIYQKFNVLIIGVSRPHIKSNRPPLMMNPGSGFILKKRCELVMIANEIDYDLFCKKVFNISENISQLKKKKSKFNFRSGYDHNNNNNNINPNNNNNNYNDNYDNNISHNNGFMTGSNQNKTNQINNHLHGSDVDGNDNDGTLSLKLDDREFFNKSIELIEFVECEKELKNTGKFLDIKKNNIINPSFNKPFSTKKEEIMNEKNKKNKKKLMKIKDVKEYLVSMRSIKQSLIYHDETDFMKYLSGKKIQSVTNKFDLIDSSNQIHSNFDSISDTTESNSNSNSSLNSNPNINSNSDTVSMSTSTSSNSENENGNQIKIKTKPKSKLNKNNNSKQRTDFKKNSIGYKIEKQFIKKESLLKETQYFYKLVGAQPKKNFYLEKRMKSLKESTILHCQGFLGHLIIVGSYNGISNYIREIRKRIWGNNIPIVILSPKMTKEQWAPLSIFSRVYYLCGNIKNSYDLSRANIQTAARLLLLPNLDTGNDYHSDPYHNNNNNNVNVNFNQSANYDDTSNDNYDNKNSISQLFKGADEIFVLKSIEQTKKFPPLIISEIDHPKSLKFLTMPERSHIINKKNNKHKKRSNKNDGGSKNNGFAKPQTQSQIAKKKSKKKTKKKSERNSKILLEKLYKLSDHSSIRPEIKYLKSDEYLTNSYYASGWIVLSKFCDLFLASAYWRPFLIQILNTFLFNNNINDKNNTKIKININNNHNKSSGCDSTTSSSSGSSNSSSSSSIVDSSNTSDNNDDNVHEQNKKIKIQRPKSKKQKNLEKNQTMNRNFNGQECFLFLFKLPSFFFHKTYFELLSYLIKIHDAIPIAIYRFGYSSPIFSPLPYVYTNPPKFTILQKRDRLYLLARDLEHINFIHDSCKKLTPSIFNKIVNVKVKFKKKNKDKLNNDKTKLINRKGFSFSSD
ncbi:calcium-activated potassium channel alpha chain [Anaeramoeba flamelloides]|uniref:Calcium-activated potassium channel alpha chain n=1 Tax=Anaeramoeba flamelloides TaxID=1746091 RepID=A0ABQ8Z497_9EUKA|nr:calcium-activated potassium channel alpha chain [Anaeramoeba flamelloides]